MKKLGQTYTNCEKEFMENLNDNKNAQARYFEKKLKEYTDLKNEQEEIASRLKLFQEFSKFMNEIDDKKDYDEYSFNHLEVNFELHHKGDGEFNKEYYTTLYRKGYSKYESVRKESRDVIRGAIKGALEVYEKYYDEINKKILDFNFLDGVDKQ